MADETGRGPPARTPASRVFQVNETERDTAQQSLFTRHPEMKDWPASHHWFFAKLNLTNIWVLDYFGGPKVVTPEEYYNVTFQ